MAELSDESPHRCKRPSNPRNGGSEPVLPACGTETVLEATPHGSPFKPVGHLLTPTGPPFFPVPESDFSTILTVAPDLLLGIVPDSRIRWLSIDGGRNDMVYVEQILTGGDRNFGYILADETTGAAALVDPSYAPDLLVQKAQKKGFRVDYILITHDHFDHTNGNDTVRNLTAARTVMHTSAPSRVDMSVVDEDEIQLGNLTVRVIHTPGHTPDSVCYLAEDALFTGDTLFVGKIGGTDLETAARQEYESLHEKLLTLPPETRVFPGHNVGTQPVSTIGHERGTNPFILQPDFKAFIHLKKNWAAHKREHGIA